MKNRQDYKKNELIADLGLESNNHFVNVLSMRLNSKFDQSADILGSHENQFPKKCQDIIRAGVVGLIMFELIENGMHFYN